MKGDGVLVSPHHIFEVPISDTKRSFWYILLSDAKWVLAGSEVYLQEGCSSL